MPDGSVRYVNLNDSSCTLVWSLKIHDTRESTGEPIVHAESLTGQVALGYTACDLPPLSPAVPSAAACARNPQADVTIPGGADGSSLSLAVGAPRLQIYAIDGVLCSPMPCGDGTEFFPGSNVTYRLLYSLPFASFRDLEIDIILPDLVFELFIDLIVQPSDATCISATLSFHGELID